MSDKMALRQIIEIAATALAEEGEEDEGGEMESEDEGTEVESDEMEPSPANVRATALRIRNARDAE
jgi:hypothetical protein